MVNHIVTRIIESFSREFQFDFTEEQDQKITAIYKWGCEGSSGHSTYRQGFVNENNISDDSLFALCKYWDELAHCGKISGHIQLDTADHWRYYIFQKESADLLVVRLEVGYINSEITKIHTTKFENFEIHHQFHLTMIDGKVFSALANSSSQVCCICKASPKQMNNIN